MTGPSAVSFVVPVLNGRRWLPRVVEAIRGQTCGLPFEIIVVDDGSTDGSWQWLQSRARTDGLVLLRGHGRGAAAALNAGVREARHPVICQVDQDVILEPGWLAALLAALEDPDVAAAQGHYILAPGAGFWARTMGRDLEWRYASMGRVTDHVCTGNTAYRASALHAAGLFDERLGYGYDNDLSYRFLAAGYRLEYCPAARSVHMWRDGARGYLRQQFGVGYGRLDVVEKHRSRVRGDTVSNSVMMAHGPLTLASLMLLLAGLAVPAAALAGAGILGLLLLERAVSGIRAAHLTRDPVALAFPATHLARNLAWCAAMIA
ncbi:MAG TPA: glycosyltransferase, partial [Vicinamibacterales bacterium]|nr:glycosyltransferase [Vicinamibacterales bacterium]